MVTQFLIFFLFSCYVVTSVSIEDTGFVRSLDHKFLGMEKKETITHFRFYWQDIVSGSNATSVTITVGFPTITPSLPKYNSTTIFGLVGIIDNALTLGPELSSKLVGRAEGFYASISQTEFDLLMVMNFVLFEGKYNGSSITILGRNVAYN
ncbi:dirigent protein 19-like [Gastrolobium bilobum]|uniref:dirigent protein 19-like n=1 Tax=Gastrolobium bilobum TaxID=150636 RepID=UPI002AB15E0D|nr:dirigent protein 19-like [Gastrolobium bilobum]